MFAIQTCFKGAPFFLPWVLEALSMSQQIRMMV